jgi:hypothetical protein
VQNVEGELQQVKSAGEKMGLGLPEIWAQLCTHAATYSAPEKRQARAKYLFRDVVGSMPPADWHIDSTEKVPVSPQLRKKILHLNIRYIKSKRRVAA